MRQCASCNAVWREGPGGGSWEPAEEHIEAAEHVYCPQCTSKREAEVQRLSAMIEERVEAHPEPAPVEEVAEEEEAAAEPVFGRGLLVAAVMLVALSLAAGLYARIRGEQTARAAREEAPQLRETRGGGGDAYWITRGGSRSRSGAPLRGPRGFRPVPARTPGSPEPDVPGAAEDEFGLAGERAESRNGEEESPTTTSESGTSSTEEESSTDSERSTDNGSSGTPSTPSEGTPDAGEEAAPEPGEIPLPDLPVEIPFEPPVEPPLPPIPETPEPPPPGF